ncbi:MAG: hypothetical protein ACXU8O_04880 [Asticcacaulis sp.]
MPSNFKLFKYVFLGVLLFLVTVISGYEMLYGIPKKKCDEAGNWWSWKYRSCAVPVYLPTITGRKPGEAAKGSSASVTIDFHEEAKKASNGKGR